MKVLLINPPVRRWAQPNCFPTGLGYIASTIRGAGHDVGVFDFNAIRQEDITYEGILRSKQYDVLGITGIITQYKEVKEIARMSREINPAAPVICGGPLATSVPDLVLKKTDVDICVRGEGEVTIVKLLNNGCKDNTIGCSTKLNGSIINANFDRPPIKDISELSWPAYDLFPIDEYLFNPIAWQNKEKWSDGKHAKLSEYSTRSMNMIGTRGCPFGCIYCYHHYMGQGYRRRYIFDILQEMQYLNDTYEVAYVHFTDDLFCGSKKWTMEFCKTKHQFDLADVTWSCAGRPSIMDEELAGAMYSAGCVGVCYGLESGSQKMLDRMNKKANVDDYRRAIEISKGFFPYEDYTFIVGTPGETDETIAASVNFCEEMGIVPSAVFYMTPYPGTSLFEELKKTNFIFAKIVNNMNGFEWWVSQLGEQGEQMAWNCSGSPDYKVHEWHRWMIEETGAMNKEKH